MTDQEKKKIIENDKKRIELKQKVASAKKQYANLVLKLQQDFLKEKEEAEIKFMEEIEQLTEKAKQTEETIIGILIESEEKRGGIISVDELSELLTLDTSDINNNDVDNSIGVQNKNTVKYVTNEEYNKTFGNTSKNKTDNKYY